MGTPIIVVGAFHEVVELCEICNFRIVGIVDNQLTGEFMGYPILGADETAQTSLKAHRGVPLVLSPDKPAVRERLAIYYTNLGCTFASLISPRAIVSRTATLGRGVLIQSGVNISCSVVVGDFVRLNTFSNVMHDVTIGAYTTVAPNAVLLGRVRVGERCYLGSNCTVLPERTVGGGATVGAGAVVTKDVPEATVVTGIPAQPLPPS